MKSWLGVFLLLAPILSAAGDKAESGALTLHMLLHAIGEEHYEISPDASGNLTMSITSETSDRGMKRTVTAALAMKPDLTPESFEIKARNSASLLVHGSDAIAKIDDAEHTVELPRVYFVGRGGAPYSVQMMAVRYWLAHGKPASLSILPSEPGQEGARIEVSGHDSITLDGKSVRLERYTIANVLWGREVLWLNAHNQLAALMTFAGGLPMEAVRTEYESALPQLFKDGVAQEMADFAALGKQVPPMRTGSFAITGATLVTGTDAAPIADSALIVRNGRIVALGPRAAVAIPKGMPVFDASGKMMLPGLWEMHSHFSGVEFGPALLAAGITTTRDCGGEIEFLTKMREAIDQRKGPGPRMLLAGLVDGSGPAAFGAVTADTPEEARAVVDRYHRLGFEQMKLYTLLKPDVIKAIADEAHRDGMTVTGHVPAALNAIQGVEAGMDQINHLNFVSTVLRPSGGRGPVDLNSEQARNAIQFFKDHHTVVDPTASWGEMAGHSKDIQVASFEPGITKAPYTLASKFLALGGPASGGERFRARMKETFAVIGALHAAGIPIVAGSDTGLIGYGLDREIELYAEAGMTPLEAIESATIVPARAMKLDRETGTLETGKRADLILVDGNPLQEIHDIRKIWRVVENGAMYDPAALWKSVGFHP